MTIDVTGKTVLSANNNAAYTLRGKRVVVVGGTSGMGLGAVRAAVQRQC